MEKVKVNSGQMFILIILFEMGSALVVGVGSSARQDAWLAVLLGLAGGLLLFSIYYKLFIMYPDIPFTNYIQKIIGKFLGRFIAYLYILYFIYIAARVLRDFGELLVTTTYQLTPIFVINTLMMLTVIYAVGKGFEVIARVGELLFIVIYLLAIVGFILIFVSGLVVPSNLLPVLGNGLKPVITTTLKETLTFPFGEMVLFTMFLPLLKNKKNTRKFCLGAIVLSGVNIAITMAINIAVLGVDINGRSPFPLLATISKIDIADFIQRLDVLFLLYLVIGGFFKVALFFYGAAIGINDLFMIKDKRKVIFPLGIMILLLSMAIASNYAEHIQEGIKVVPIYLHWPFQIIIPLFLFVVATIRKKRLAATAH